MENKSYAKYMLFLDEITSAVDNCSSIHLINASSHTILFHLPLNDIVINKPEQHEHQHKTFNGLKTG